MAELLRPHRRGLPHSYGLIRVMNIAKEVFRKRDFPLPVLAAEEHPHLAKKVPAYFQCRPLAWITVPDASIKYLLLLTADGKWAIWTEGACSFIDFVSLPELRRRWGIHPQGAFYICPKLISTVRRRLQEIT